MHSIPTRTRAAALLLVPLLGLAACGRDGTVVEEAPQAADAAGSAKEADASFGSLTDVCGPGDGGERGATAQGVTADSIQLGVISDVGFPGQPGLNQELFDVAEVFSSWCNDLGGINGRTLDIVERDAAIFNYKQQILEACAADFALVGGFGVSDNQGVNDRLKCLLPDFPSAQVSSATRGADLTWTTSPQQVDRTNLGMFHYLDEKFPDAGSAAGIFYGDTASIKSIHDANVEAMKQVGWNVVYDEQYNSVGETSYLPFAQAMKSRGLKVVVYIGGAGALASLEQAFRQVEYYPDAIVSSSNAYDEELLTNGDGAIKNTFMQVNGVPFEQASESPALQRYLELFAQYKPDGKDDAVLGQSAFAQWLLFAHVAKQCGNELTRACLAEKAETVTEWDGGGLHGKANPAGNVGTSCYAVVRAEGTEFSVPDDFTTTEGLFNCEERNVFPLSGDYGTPATLADVGKSLADLQ